MLVYYSFNLYGIFFGLKVVKDIKNSFVIKRLFTYTPRLSSNNAIYPLRQKAIMFGPLAISEVLFESADIITLLSHFPEMLLIIAGLLA